MKIKLFLLFCLIQLLSCKTNVDNETQVYYNDFESNNLTSIQNGIIGQFNGSNVLGNYYNQNFILSLKDLPTHDLISITYDLYIHDQWGGNQSSPSGPDIWQMLADGKIYINTTFSNAVCGVNTFCPPQSYPDNYPNSNHNPKSGAYQTNLPGFCSMKGVVGWTTLYKISKTFTHKSNALSLECLDKSVKTDSLNPKCDESWSIDNLVVKTIKL